MRRLRTGPARKAATLTDLSAQPVAPPRAEAFDAGGAAAIGCHAASIDVRMTCGLLSGPTAMLFSHADDVTFNFAVTSVSNDDGWRPLFPFPLVSYKLLLHRLRCFTDTRAPLPEAGCVIRLAGCHHGCHMTYGVPPSCRRYPHPADPSRPARAQCIGTARHVRGALRLSHAPQGCHMCSRPVFISSAREPARPCPSWQRWPSSCPGNPSSRSTCSSCTALGRGS